MHAIVRRVGVAVTTGVLLATWGCGGGGGGGRTVLLEESFDAGFPAGWDDAGAVEVDVAVGLPPPALHAGTSAVAGFVVSDATFATDRGLVLRAWVRPAPGAFVSLFLGPRTFAGLAFGGSAPVLRLFAGDAEADVDFTFDGAFHELEVEFLASGHTRFAVDGEPVGALDSTIVPATLGVGAGTSLPASAVFVDEILLTTR